MKSTQKKHKFNAIDAAIIIVIAAVICAAAFFFLSGEETETPVAQTVNIEYTVELRSIRDEFTDNFNVGDGVVDGVALYRLGQVVAIDVTPAVYTGTNLVTGESVSSPYPEHSNVVLTVSAEATVNELGRYTLGGGYDLSVGTLVYVRTPGYIGYGYCTGIIPAQGGVQ